MKALSWVRSRPKAAASVAGVVIGAVALTTMAVAYDGLPTTKVDLNDAGVWLTKSSSFLVGHFNHESTVLDGGMRAARDEYDILQDGGTVLVEPMAVGELGVMAFVAGPGGEAVGFWQDGTFTGHDLPLTAGTSVWFELMSTRFDDALEFYRAVAGWEPTLMGDDGEGGGDSADDGAEEGPRYAMNHPMEHASAGVCDASSWLPEGAVGYWRMYIGVEDTDAALEVVREHGGRVLDGPQDSPFGRVTTVTDPAGATFQLNEPNRG